MAPRLPRIDSRDVAAAAGVSQATVSRALRNDPNIATKTRQHVEEVARLLHYVPNELGRNLKNQATGRIAFVADLDNPLWPLLVARGHDELMKRGYGMTLLAEHGDPTEMAANLASGGVDGVIIGSAKLQAHLPGQLSQKGIPFVLVNRTIEGVEADASVADNFGGGEAAAKLLISAGHRRIGAMFGPLETSTGRDRESGFRAGMAHGGLSLPKSRVRHGAFDYAYGSEALPTLLGGRFPPTAIFCSNDIIAIGAINMAYRLGLRIPDDIALMGFDDLEQASWPVFGLTTIKVPFDDMLHTAIDVLLKRLGGEHSEPQVCVHPVVPVLRVTHQLVSEPSPKTVTRLRGTPTSIISHDN